MPALVPDGRLPFAPANAPTEPSETPPGTAEARRAPTGTASFQGVPLSAVLPFAHSTGTARLSSLGLSLPPAAVGEATSDAAKAQEGPALCTTCELTLNQYAAFCAELEVCLEDSAEIFRRYGLGSARDAVRLASQWQQRFEENAAEFEEWQRLHRLYVDECRAKGRPEVAP